MSGRVVIIAATAYAAIEAACRAERDGLETGGILLGHQHTSGALSVSVAGDAGPRAERTRHSFRRDGDHARALAAKGYAHDRSVWLGEWHTHPDGPSHPSSMDLNAYADIVRDPQQSFDVFLSLIILPMRARLLLTAWTVSDQTVERVPTKVGHPG